MSHTKTHQNLEGADKAARVDERQAARASQVSKPFMIAGIGAIGLYVAYQLLGGASIVLGPTKMTLDRAQELAFAQLPMVDNFRNQTDLPKKKIFSQPVDDQTMYLGFAELGMNDDVTISLACVKATGDKATLIKKVIPGLGKEVKIQTLKVGDIDLTTCEPKDKSLGPIPTLP